MVLLNSTESGVYSGFIIASQAESQISVSISLDVEFQNIIESDTNSIKNKIFEQNIDKEVSGIINLGEERIEQAKLDESSPEVSRKETTGQKGDESSSRNKRGSSSYNPWAFFGLES